MNTDGGKTGKELCVSGLGGRVFVSVCMGRRLDRSLDTPADGGV